MKKRAITLILSALLLTTACHNEQAAINKGQEENVNVRSITTDLYTVQVDSDWQWEIIDYHDGTLTSDVIFYDEKKNVIGGMDIVVAIHDKLADIPNKIRVLGEEMLENGWIVGKTETVDNAAGGDTTSQCHVLIPLESDHQMHEYIDLYLDGERFDLEKIQDLAQTVVIRNQQLFGYVLAMDSDTLTFCQGRFVSENDARWQKLQLTAKEQNQGFAIVASDERQILSLSPDVCYYLIDTEDDLFHKVDQVVFVENLQKHPEMVYDLTIQDGIVISVEERLL